MTQPLEELIALKAKLDAVLAPHDTALKEKLAKNPADILSVDHIQSAWESISSRLLKLPLPETEKKKMESILSRNQGDIHEAKLSGYTYPLGSETERMKEAYLQTIPNSLDTLERLFTEVRPLREVPLKENLVKAELLKAKSGFLLAETLWHFHHHLVSLKQSSFDAALEISKHQQNQAGDLLQAVDQKMATFLKGPPNNASSTHTSNGTPSNKTDLASALSNAQTLLSQAAAGADWQKGAERMTQRIDEVNKLNQDLLSSRKSIMDTAISSMTGLVGRVTKRFEQGGTPQADSEKKSDAKQSR